MKLGWVGGGKAGTLEEAAAAQVQWEVWLSTSQFPICASNLSGETWYSAIISKQGKLLQVDGLGLNLAIFIPMF